MAPAVRNGKRFVQIDIPGSGAPAAADGIRCDVDGKHLGRSTSRRTDHRAGWRAASE
jgi:hypothetical protein